MDVGRSVRGWAKDEPSLAAPLIALAQELERSARSTLLTLAHCQASTALETVMPSSRPRATG
jgi:hypothetical protein